MRPGARVSVRDIREGTYRALRAAGVPAGPAADAAVDVLALEVQQRAGLRLLARVLETDAGGHIPHCRIAADRVTIAEPGTMLLLAHPLADLALTACGRDLEITGGDDAQALMPPIMAVSEATGVSVCVAAGSRCLLHTRPSTAGTWLWHGEPSDSSRLLVRAAQAAGRGPDPLGHDPTGTCTTPGAWHAAWDHAATYGLTITQTSWQMLSENAARFLV